MVVRSTIILTVAVVLSTTWSLPARADLARGHVFLDRDGDEMRDLGEPGLGGVGVSNGRDIVTTDATGYYELAVDDDTIVFVLKPRGFRTPVDDNQLPRFYYIHKPAGSPPLRYPGVEPTGPLPAAIDFPLYPQSEPEQFHALLFGDTQPRNQEEIDYIAHDIVEQLIETDASFSVTLGDIMYDDISLFESLNRTIALIGIPWYNVVGNHDLNFDAPDDRLSDETFEASYGPPYYSFDHGPVHFLVLDDVIWKGPVTDPDEYPGGNYIGGFDERQLQFVANDLARIPDDQLVVLMMHIPLTAAFEDDLRQRLYRLIEPRPFTLSISAHHHAHEHRFLTRDDGWRGPEPHHHMITVTTCGSWWTGAPDETGIPHATQYDGTPNGWAVISFDGHEYTIDYRAARRPASEQMLIWAPEVIARGDAAEFFVNVYNGSERSAVEFRLGDRTWRPMERTVRPDPYFLALKVLEESDTPPPGRRLPEEVDSPHLWRGVLPDDVPAGTHLVEVRTTDMWGREYRDWRVIRVD
jgi:hypothetical protein